MIKLTIGITCCAVGLLALGLPACSSAEDPPGTGGTSSSGGTGSAGTPSTGGTSAGTSSTGGSAGTSSTGGSAGAGTGGTNPVGCQGISRDMPCPTEGQACPGLKCGLCDSGTRECNCTAGVWACTSCDFSASEFMTAPTAPEACGSQADEVLCTGMMGAVCTGAPNNQVCGCCNPATFTDGEVWDCDSAPSTWP